MWSQWYHVVLSNDVMDRDVGGRMRVPGEGWYELGVGEEGTGYEGMR